MPRGKKNNYSELFGGLDLPKDRFDADREGYVDEEGNYHFNTMTGVDGDTATPCVIPHYGPNGEDNSKWIEFLANEDHKVNIQKRNDADNADKRDAFYKKMHDWDADVAKSGANPMDKESYRRWFEEAFREDDESEDEDPMLEFIHEFLCNLPDADQTIMFGIFGMSSQQNEIAEELKRKPQSVNRTVKRIEKRLAKALAEKFGCHVEDRTQKE